MTDPAAPSSPAEPIDSGLRCLTCDYNLTGLEENRCPECGSEFDPEELRRAIDRDSIEPATPWDTDGGWRGFWRTWWLAWRWPGRLANQFPGTYAVPAARSYSLWCYGCAIMLLLAATPFLLIPMEGDVDEALKFLVSLAVGAVTGFVACESGVAAILALLVRPRRLHRSYNFWRGMTHYASGHSLITGCFGVFAIGLLTVKLDERQSYFLGLFTLVAGAAIYFDWLRALCTMVAARGIKRGSMQTVFLLMLLTGLCSIAIARTISGCLYDAVSPAVR